MPKRLDESFRRFFSSHSVLSPLLLSSVDRCPVLFKNLKNLATKQQSRFWKRLFGFLKYSFQKYFSRYPGDFLCCDLYLYMQSTFSKCPWLGIIIMPLLGGHPSCRRVFKHCKKIQLQLDSPKHLMFGCPCRKNLSKIVICHF